MATSGWTVLVFGDSWAKYSHPTWPEVLARRLGANCLNFAMPGGVSQGLVAQGNQALMTPQVPKMAGGMLARQTLVVVHTGGNDFISKISDVAMMMFSPGGARPNVELFQPNPGRREAETIASFMENMYRAGARHFLISGVPAFIHMPIFNMLWMIVQGMINDGRLEALGISPGDPPQLAVEVQATAINERWSETVDTFGASHRDASCCFFNEVEALERIRGRLGERQCDSQMWDFSMFHPTVFGHEQLADEAKHLIEAVHLLSGGQRTAAAAYSAPAAAPAAAQPTPAAVPTPAPPPALPEKPIAVQVKSVKGAAAFTLTCNANGTVAKLREAILAAAPEEARGPPGAPCRIVVKGKILPEDTSSTLSDLGIAEGALIVFSVKGT